jgi:hypothetical protein
MNTIAVIIAAVIGLVAAWLIAGPKWGITIGALAGGITALVTVTGNDSYVQLCKDRFGGFAPGCTDPGWWTLHGHTATLVITAVVAVIGATWFVAWFVKMDRAATEATH